MELVDGVMLEGTGSGAGGDAREFEGAIERELGVRQGPTRQAALRPRVARGCGQDGLAALRIAPPLATG